ncbi:Chromosome replication initiation and membrane attachment protein [Metamycoplasma cloacale]|uniref:Uncharacterized protein n=1 Tax=Metamycoplasma cloacale TaxID=92401 RepID=A0A2Z4LL79_9BACT|nr:DnaD domain protein [Metamycoplasma cloacale]AWX42480.1 hypothetical protein DK849_00045 [Metamycoplasma cloacale]VEU79174.1 Chromosome replication initiation and membrane attachment protein [Metamycoplasma cloacale]
MEKYYIENSESITSSDLENLRVFYQPFIGPNAISLYQYLYDMHTIYDARHNFTYNDTNEFLSISKEEMVKARQLLEATGLIKSFLTKDQSYLFQLKRPLNANEITQNKLISSLLIEKIGIEKFQQLIKVKTVTHFDKTCLVDISKNFLDVFQPNETIDVELNDEDFILTDRNLAMESLEPEIFIYTILKAEPTSGQLLMIEHLKQLHFSRKAINLFINYSLNVNKSIVIKYIEKIALDFAKKNILNEIDVERELDNIYINKTTNKNLQSNVVMKPTHLEDLNYIYELADDGWEN